MQTGKYASGSAFMREVNLCPKCAEEQDRLEAAKKRQQWVLMVGLALAVGLLAFWWFALRPQ
jgi:hypothetical protein